MTSIGKTMLQRLILKSVFGLGLVLIWQGCAASKMAHDVNDIPGEYQKGLKFMEKKNWLKAEEVFTFIVYNDPAGEFADDAQFQLGECYMAMKDYDKAIKTLVKVEVNYSKFKNWTARSILEMGQALDRKGDKKAAIEQYKQVVKKYLGSDEANVARELLQHHKVYIDE